MLGAGSGDGGMDGGMGARSRVEEESGFSAEGGVGCPGSSWVLCAGKPRYHLGPHSVPPWCVVAASAAAQGLTPQLRSQPLLAHHGEVFLTLDTALCPCLVTQVGGGTGPAWQGEPSPALGRSIVFPSQMQLLHCKDERRDCVMVRAGGQSSDWLGGEK